MTLWASSPNSALMHWKKIRPIPANEPKNRSWRCLQFFGGPYFVRKHHVFQSVPNDFLEAQIQFGLLQWPDRSHLTSMVSCVACFRLWQRTHVFFSLNRGIPSHHPFLDGDFPRKKPSSVLLGYSHDEREIPIYVRCGNSLDPFLCFGMFLVRHIWWCVKTYHCHGRINIHKPLLWGHKGFES